MTLKKKEEIESQSYRTGTYKQPGIYPDSQSHHLHLEVLEHRQGVNLTHKAPNKNSSSILIFLLLSFEENKA